MQGQSNVVLRQSNSQNKLYINFPVNSWKYFRSLPFFVPIIQSSFIIPTRYFGVLLVLLKSRGLIS